MVAALLKTAPTAPPDAETIRLARAATKQSIVSNLRVILGEGDAFSAAEIAAISGSVADELDSKDGLSRSGLLARLHSRGMSKDLADAISAAIVRGRSHL